MTQRALPRLTRPSASARLVLLALAIAFAGTGCGKIFKKKEAPENQPVEVMYQEAHQAMANNNWDRGLTSFRRLIAQYPYGPYTEQALMETAYAEYKAGNANYKAMKQADLDHPIEATGKKLRAAMAWLSTAPQPSAQPASSTAANTAAKTEQAAA